MARKPRTSDEDKEILKEAKERFERCVTWESTARANALLDARFANGDSYNQAQWGMSEITQRSGRPCLTFNKTRQHILQIVNEARQHKAAIKVTPTGDRATYEAAQIFSGIIRRIEYQSKAIDAYTTAIFHQVETGIGYVRVVTDYASEDSFSQEIFVRRIQDPRTVYLDPDAKEYDKADMRFAFVFNDIPRDTYEALHGEGDMVAPAALDHSDGWNDKDHVREAEYWRRGDKDDKLHLLMDGRQVRESDMPEGAMGGLMRQQIHKSRDISEPEIEWFRIVGDRIDERKTWPGRYIPIVPFIGEEVVIDNVMDRKGHTRALLDAQRMYNYWSSAAVEQVALQGKSPYLAPGRAVEGYEKYWDAANVTNWPYLPYNDIDDAGNPIRPPERSQPPTMAQAYIEGMNIAKDEMMLVSGQYQAQMGANGNEISGTAIQQRQRQGDNATYHYIDNQSKGIRQVGRICLDLIPKVYDVATVMKIMAEDGTDSDVALMPNAPDAHQHVAMGPQGPQPISPDQAKTMTDDPDQPDPKVIFNPNIGRYDVEADVGPSYGTRREEAANAFTQIMANNHEAFNIVGDFWARNSDFPGADELADRLKMGLPPQYAGANPQVAQLQQQMQQMQAKFHEMMQGAQQKVINLQQELKDKGTKHDIEDYKAETDRLAAVGSIDPNSLQIIVRQMVENMLGTSLTPALQNHAAIEQSLQPPDPGAQQPPQPPQPPPGPDPLAVQAQGHQQMMDRAKLGLQAQAQAHNQRMDLAGHGLAVQQAQQQPAAAP